MADAAPLRENAANRDLVSIAEARTLAAHAKAVWPTLAELTQEQIDAIVDAMAAAATPQAEAFARMAVEETGYGVVEDKIQKNLFGSERIYTFIRPMKTVGIVARHPERRLVEIAEPFGVVAAIIPSTNPTSTTIYKILIAIKARCPIVLSPHPSAVRCITRVAEVMDEAARRAGAPAGAIGWMTTVTLEGTQALMKHRDVAVILATGGMGLVRAAYSAGKPAYGVGPGNAPAYIERTADVRKAVRDIITGKTFDNGVLCSSENSVVCDEPVAEAVKREFQAQGGYFLSRDEMDRVARVLVTPQRLPNPALVGKSAVVIAEKCGITVPAETRVLLAPLDGVGREYPLSIEKLCPVLSFYVVRDWREGCERCKQILRYGGMGHTMSIHSQNEQVILEFGLKKPAFRVIVNSPTTFGSIGLSTGLDPAMTLGCGGYGGNITSDNISPRHLLNIKRLSYEVTSVPNRFERASGVRPAASPTAAPLPPSNGISQAVLTDRIDRFLESRGYKPEAVTAAAGAAVSVTPSPETPRPAQIKKSTKTPLDFVCEDDVRRALGAGETLLVTERAIITPSARELGEARRVFEVAPWNG
ncbi:MAG: aldehyde dehydrogenase family protein [Acidobacteriaceae bacterium]|jgi:acetaldehyde dehydrogenase (acetylating)|nr:aldehyde dehydrogenase family protein [Acidobacteriaceae bacterium]